jgi:hypothetical protein
MKTFKNGPVSGWRAYDLKDVMHFGTNKPRHVKFGVISNSTVEVWVSDNEALLEPCLMASSAEKMQVEFTIDKDCWVQIRAQKGSKTFVNLPDLDQSLANNGLETYTVIEPRLNNTSEFDRMMQIVKFNERQREALMAQERADMQARLAELEAKANPPVAEDVPSTSDLVEPPQSEDVS